MIYSQKNLAMRLLPDSSDCSEAVLPIQGLKSVKAIDFDPEEQYLYWVSDIYFILCMILKEDNTMVQWGFIHS